MTLTRLAIPSKYGYVMFETKADCVCPDGAAYECIEFDELFQKYDFVGYYHGMMIVIPKP